MIALVLAPTSDYQLLKLHVLRTLGLSKDAAHVYVGVLLLLATVALARVPLRSWRALLPGLVATAVMEALDLRDGHADDGRWRWAASLKDVVNTNLLPLVIVAAARGGLLRR